MIGLVAYYDSQWMLVVLKA